MGWVRPVASLTSHRLPHQQRTPRQHGLPAQGASSVSIKHALPPFTVGQPFELDDEKIVIVTANVEALGGWIPCTCAVYYPKPGRRHWILRIGSDKSTH